MVHMKPVSGVPEGGESGHFDGFTPQNQMKGVQMFIIFNAFCQNNK